MKWISDVVGLKIPSCQNKIYTKMTHTYLCSLVLLQYVLVPPETCHNLNRSSFNSSRFSRVRRVIMSSRPSSDALRKLPKAFSRVPFEYNSSKYRAGSAFVTLVYLQPLSKLAATVSVCVEFLNRVKTPDSRILTAARQTHTFFMPRAKSKLVPEAPEL